MDSYVDYQLSWLLEKPFYNNNNNNNNNENNKQQTWDRKDLCLLQLQIQNNKQQQQTFLVTWKIDSLNLPEDEENVQHMQ